MEPVEPELEPDELEPDKPELDKPELDKPELALLSVVDEDSLLLLLLDDELAEVDRVVFVLEVAV